MKRLTPLFITTVLAIQCCALLGVTLTERTQAATSLAVQYRILGDTIPDPGVVGGGSDRPTQQLRPSSPAALYAILNGLWNRITSILYALIGAYAILTLSLAALRYGAARGDTKKTAEARNAIVQTVLGVALLTASVMVVSLIWSFVRVFA